MEDIMLPFLSFAECLKEWRTDKQDYKTLGTSKLVLATQAGRI